ncbi:5'-nucleotidase C-terminal domain-containing protein [Kiloniella laminariae]|uniref:5'-nucleotidase C-terminal domain-containing protein n=1 Tax=Kiloniella laminariae TaxID=454162 RepID=A0ABT4LEA7_9PROT|nr:5'-nucleotidase C-terminal domain-containing protein [Kiloniella laminariae]MCZ4279439.1 5'-nucleotidase C-terminal domain-containing protein [Kiloniella laminariae]
MRYLGGLIPLFTLVLIQWIGMTPVLAEYSLTVLHVNDLHSRLLPLNRQDVPCSEKELAAQKCFGGYARLAKALEDRRKDLNSQKENTLLLHAGDEFEGSLFYAHYQGLASIVLLNDMNIDAMALGNHEFDGGPGVLRRLISKAGFPLLGANIAIDDSSILAGQIPPHHIIERGGEQIAIIGVITERTAEISTPGDQIEFEDALETVREEVETLTARGINKIILLSHLGLAQDKEVAARVPHIDLIVGGHNRTLSPSRLGKDDEAYPFVVLNPLGQPVPLVRTYGYGKYYGEITLTFDEKGVVQHFDGDSVLLDQSFTENDAVRSHIEKIDQELQKIRQITVGEAGSFLNADRDDCRSSECTMGNLISDALLWRFEKRRAEAVIINSGGLRASLEAGPVSWGDILTVLPFKNSAVLLNLKGSTVLLALENGLSKVEESDGRFPQISGMRIIWDSSREPGQRVVSVEIKDPNQGYLPLEPDRIYRVIVNDYMLQGGDGYALQTNQRQKAFTQGPRMDDILADYISAFGPVSVELDGRIKQK